MRFVYLLEDDPKFQKEICESIHAIDPKIQVRLFASLENFVDWIRDLIAKGAPALVTGGEVPSFIPSEIMPPEEAHELVCVISKVEFLNSQHLSLMRKTRDTFVHKKLCRAEDPTAFVLTAFDSSEFNLSELQDPAITNVIFKPFDRLILAQHLTFAIDGRHPPSKYTIQNQKTSAVIEMLKEIDLESVSMCGFTTKSERTIVPGTPAKYYGDIFKSDRQKSVIAVAQESLPHKTEGGKNECSFTFFGLDQSQITSLRKKMLVKDQVASPYSWLETQKKLTKAQEVNVVVIDEEESTESGIRGTLQRHFENLKFTVYDSLTPFLIDLDPANMFPKGGPVKGLSQPMVVALFDDSGMQFLGFENSTKDPIVVFGETEADLKKNPQFFHQKIVSEHKDKFKKIVSGRPDRSQDLVCRFANKESTYLVRIDGLSKDAGIIKVKMTEPSKEEQTRWYTSQSKLPKSVDALIINHRFVSGEGAKERWQGIFESLVKRAKSQGMDPKRNPKLFMISIKDYSDQEKREMSSYVADIFFKPVDRVYFIQKFHYWFPHLRFIKETIAIPSFTRMDKIKTASPVSVVELSEAGVVMNYTRSMNVGEFREFVLWQPYEVGAPELLASCNFIEEREGANGKEYNHHFVFFGINDYFLKHIRVWIRDNYILSKEAGGS